MKRYKIVVFILIINILFSSVGCTSDAGSNDEYKIYTYGYSDSELGITHIKDFELWSKGDFVNNDAPKERAFTFNGKEVRGVYTHSKYWESNNFPSDYYETETGGTFTTDQNGFLCSYLSRIAFDPQLPVVSQDECVAVAKAFVNTLVNIEDYKITVKWLESFEEYYVSFEKYIGEVETADSIRVCINENGVISSFDSFMLGKIPKTTSIDFDLEAIKIAVKEKLDKIYAEKISEFDTVNYEYLLKFTFLENEKKAIMCAVRIEFSMEDNPLQKYSDLVRFVVVQEEI